MKEASLDFIIQPKGLLNYGSIFSKAQSIARKAGVHPAAIEQGAKGAAKLSSANPRKSQLVLKPQIDPYSADKNPITRGFHTPSRIKTSSVEPPRHKKDLELFNKWKQNPSGETLKPILKEFKPLVTAHVNRWSNSGINKNLIENQAQNLVLNGLQTYDPSKKIQLSTHITNNLKPLSRFVANNQNVVRIPEANLQAYRKVISGEEGVDIKKDMEQRGSNLASHKTFTENFYSKSIETGSTPAMDELSSDAMALSMLYDELDKTDQFIFKHTVGYKGAPIIPNQEIAKKLNISPPAVTKRKNKITDRYKNLSYSVGKVW